MVTRRVRASPDTLSGQSVLTDCPERLKLTSSITWEGAMPEFLFVYLPWLWLGAIVVGSSVTELLWSGVVVLRAADVGYDQWKCEARRPKVDLGKALRRRITWPRLGLPLFAVCAGLFVVQLLWMSAFTYTVVSIAWFLGAVPRRLWGIAVMRRRQPR